MATAKLTRKDYFIAVRDALKGEVTADISYQDLDLFLQKEIEALNTKAYKARERAATKRADSDALADAIADIVPDEFTSIPDITAMLNDPIATVAKVTYRLNALVADGILEKAIMPVGKKNIVMYKHI